MTQDCLEPTGRNMIAYVVSPSLCKPDDEHVLARRGGLRISGLRRNPAAKHVESLTRFRLLNGDHSFTINTHRYPGIPGIVENKMEAIGIIYRV